MNRHNNCGCDRGMRDCGGEPAVLNMDRLAKANPNFRTALWTGRHLQGTLMSIPVGGDIGVEMHPDVDQFIRIESGNALVRTGCCRDSMKMQQRADSRFAIFVPAGTWHNVINTGSTPLNLYSVYAPPQHPFGTVHRTKEDAEKHEH